MPSFIKKTGFLFLFFALTNIIIQAQEEKKEMKRYLGIGLSIPVFAIHELEEEFVPQNRILIGFDPIEYLRIEVHGALCNDKKQLFSFSHSNDKNLLFNLNQESQLIGGGLFGVYPKGNFKFIAGVRWSKNYYDFGRISSSDGEPKLYTEHGNLNILAGVLATEYFFNKWFSVTGELGLIQMKHTSHSELEPEPITVWYKGIIEGGIEFTFYPF